MSEVRGPFCGLAGSLRKLKPQLRLPARGDSVANGSSWRDACCALPGYRGPSRRKRAGEHEAPKTRRHKDGCRPGYPAKPGRVSGWHGIVLFEAGRKTKRRAGAGACVAVVPVARQSWPPQAAWKGKMKTDRGALQPD